MSNTKLNKAQKFDMKINLANLLASGGAIYANAESGVTVAVKPAFPGSNTVKVSTSVSSPKEKKFRPSVGKHKALENMLNEIYIVMPTPRDVEYLAEHLSDVPL